MIQPATSEAKIEEDHVNHELVRSWLVAGFLWLALMPSIGILIALSFSFPDYLGTIPYLTFGRLRPVHVNGVIFGSFSTLFLGMVYYVLPRLTGIRVHAEKLGFYMLYVWNLALLAGSISILLGFNQGLEVAEFPLPIDIMIFVVLLGFTYQIMLTVRDRKEKRLYVSLWYLIAAFIWTDMSFALGNFILPYFIPGVNNAAFHGLFIHYTVGLWITPAGYVLIYYFLPPAARTPLYSHKLSLIGFWSLAMFYPMVGTHHYLFSPIQEWVETIAIVASMLLIVPVWTVLQNFIGTIWGKWHLLQEDYTVRFLIVGAIYYLIGCFQGSTEALREIQTSTHFTDFVIGHSHITIAGVFVLWAIGSAYYVMPRLYEKLAVREGVPEERPLHNRLAFMSAWMIDIGLISMVALLTYIGIYQGLLWLGGTEFVDSMSAIKPFWGLRTIAGIALDTGITLSVINFMLLDRKIRRSRKGAVTQLTEGATP